MLDSRLKFVLEHETDAAALGNLEATGRFAVWRDAAPDPQKVSVLVQVDPKVPTSALEAAGLVVTTRAGDVVAGDIAVTAVRGLDSIEGVLLVESARPLNRELDLSVAEIQANLVHTGPPGRRGAGVIVGIIDSGIDWRHQTFRDPTGLTRILRIWDQALTAQAGESSPQPFGYGVEYDSGRINAALAAANPLAVVRHMDDEVGHGTHVAGIAAGDGSPPGNGFPPATIVGVAPEADIVLVANRVTTEAMGDSASTLDAVQYIMNVAAALGRPCVINLSQGDNLGPHDGTSLLERGIDNLLGAAGRAMVKSAGNAANAGVHASGTVAAGGSVAIPVQFPPGDNTPDTIDLWYPASDRLSVRITPPAGAASVVVAAGNSTTLQLPNGNRVFVDSVINHPNNGDNRIYLQFQPGAAPQTQAGNWMITLVGATVSAGGWHGWVERGNTVPQFLPPFRNDAVTISVPGTSREIVTAGSYITRGAGVGNLSSFSSRGPTRDGRAAPTLSAPGQQIASARVNAAGNDQWVGMSGTSMAAPHLTGVIALMLQAEPRLTQAQIAQCLVGTARADGFTGQLPNADWGAGKVDALAAVRQAAAVFGVLPPPVLPPFTRFTIGPVFPPQFTSFTTFTRFTPFTPFVPTPFTRFTRFLPRPIPRDPVPPFLRFRNAIFDPRDLALENFPEFAPFAGALSRKGVTRLDQLVTLEAAELGESAAPVEAIDWGSLMHAAQETLRRLAS